MVALLLTAIGWVVYRICRHWMGRGLSLGVAALFYAWSFLRETENLYNTRYTLVVLGYLALVLAALQFKKLWMKPVALVLFLAFGAWALGAPAQKYYGKWWGTPVVAYDRMIGLDTEVDRENWDKVLRLSEKDLYMTEASFCYNLAHAKKGQLGQGYFKHSQDGLNSLFIRINTDKSPFTDGLAGEAWFQLGDMTIAEQSAIIALQASPKHTGARYIRRLARASLLAGEEASAQKYLGLLSKTLFYGKWARRLMPGNQPSEVASSLEDSRTRLTREDFVHYSTRPRPVLLGLLEANPDNTMAREYLLCCDLVTLDLDHFVEDFPEGVTPTSIYREALLIWLSQQDRLDGETLAHYGLSDADLERMERFFQNPDRFRGSYWYYYLNAMNHAK